MKLSAGNLEIEVRPGGVGDVPTILSFIRSMAEFEKLDVFATDESLRESLFGSSPAARTLLAFAGDEPVAYAVYFFSFATMVGKRCMWVDDLFVSPDYRGKGIGKALMAYLADLAVRHDCGRLEWIVLDWNTPAIALYRGLGADVLENWRICRLEGEALTGVAERLKKINDGE